MSSTSIYIENLHKSCVYLVTYSGDKLPPKFKDSTIAPTKYIGSGFVDKIFNGYRGSVASQKYAKIWKQELKENPHLFHLEFISFHNDRKEALEEETKIQIKLNVILNETYINLSFANGKRICIGHTEETKKKISSTKINITEETRKKKAISASLPTSWNGVSYPSVREAVLASGLSYYKFVRMIKLGIPGKRYSFKPVSYKDIIYPSIKEAVESTGLSYYKLRKDLIHI